MAPYVIITPAHNEEAFIEKTIEALVAQTVRPLRWIVVNDASTDKTGAIVGKRGLEHDFIEVVEHVRPAGRHFGNKVRAFNLGLAKAAGVNYEYIGNLDADISLEPDYFERLLSRFEKDPKLGIAGGLVHSFLDGEYESQRLSLDSVAGAVQLFRRECFEQLGGYLALPNGGIDAAAEIGARMRGWKTRTLPELRVLEHRYTGSATSGSLASRLKEGRRMHALGYCPWFFFFRCLYRARTRPALVGSCAALYGYLESVLTRQPPALPPEVVRFLRREQHAKLLRLVGCGSPKPKGGG